MNQFNKSRRTYAGFTMIELMLSMSFIALLLLAIASSVIFVNSVYSKGILVKSVNESGRLIANTIKSDISASRMISVPTTAIGIGTPVNTVSYVNGPHGGRLCMANVSYVWNYAASLNSANRNRFAGETSTSVPIRFIRVDDRGQLCANPTQNVDRSKATEYLTGTDGLDLALYGFRIYSSSRQHDAASGQRLYTVDFTLGTSDASMVRDSSNPLLDRECTPPAESSNTFNYCSINRFNLTARAANI